MEETERSVITWLLMEMYSEQRYNFHMVRDEQYSGLEEKTLPRTKMCENFYRRP